MTIDKERSARIAFDLLTGEGVSTVLLTGISRLNLDRETEIEVRATLEEMNAKPWKIAVACLAGLDPEKREALLEIMVRSWIPRPVPRSWLAEQIETAEERLEADRRIWDPEFREALDWIKGAGKTAP